MDKITPNKPARQKRQLQKSLLASDLNSDSTYCSIDKNIQHQVCIEPVPLNSYFNKSKSGNQEPFYSTVKKDSAELRVLTSENQKLKETINNLIKTNQKQDDSWHAQLKLQVTQLETETRQEVKLLSDRIKILMDEKQSLSVQVDILVEDKNSLQLQVEELNNYKREMEKTVRIETKKALEALEAIHNIENELQKSKESQKDLSAQLADIQKQQSSLLLEHNDVLEQQAASQQMEQELQKIFLSLLKVTEEITMERDLLLNKSSFQELQQRQIHTSLLDYSLSVGRLQEHITKLSAKTNEEPNENKNNDKRIVYPQWHQAYQNSLLAKISDQSIAMKQLEEDKRKLESQVETFWEKAYSGDSGFMESFRNATNT